MIRRILRKWPYFLGFTLILLVYLAWPGSDSFTVSPETTYATGPVDAHGYVDYAHALNEKLRGEITPESNANVLLWKAIGPHPEGEGVHENYFKWLGIPAPPEDGEYYRSWETFVDVEIKKITFDEDDATFTPGTVREQWINNWDKAANRPWKKEEYPDIARWLEQNKKPLALFHQAAQCEQYYNPLISPPTQGTYSTQLFLAPLKNVQAYRGIVSALIVRAMLHAANNDDQLAWKDLMACLRMGRLVSRGGMLIESLVAHACTTMALNAIHDILQAKPQSGAKLQTWLQDIQSLPPMKPIAENIDVTERMAVLEVLTSLIANKSRFQLDTLNLNPSKPPQKNAARWYDSLFSPNVQWDPAYRLINHEFDRAARIAEMPNYLERSLAINEYEDDIKKTKKELIQPKSILRYMKSRSERGEMYGEFILGQFLPAINKISQAEERCKQTQSNLEIVLALAAYRADQRQYPDKLELLAPKYLKSIPLDRFSQLPLFYTSTPDSYSLYSVGPNLEDNKGIGPKVKPYGGNSVSKDGSVVIKRYNVDVKPDGDDIGYQTPQMNPVTNP
jgi:hypothetical protein